MLTRFLNRSARIPFPESFESEHAVLLRKHVRLSPTQVMVAVGVWPGLAEKQIAHELRKSPHTVHQHTRTSYQRLGQLGFKCRVGVAVTVAWGSLVLAVSGCTKPAEPRNALPTLTVPTVAAVTMNNDSTVTLYYSPLDCFTCFGVLGHWAAVANTTEVKVRLSLDYQPDEKTIQAIRRMRLPFELGITAPEDDHSRRGPNTIKELLSVRGRVVDSAVVRSKTTSSPLLSRMKITT